MGSKTLLLAIAAAGLLLYSNILLNGFVWDDEEQILANSAVHSLARLPQFFSGSTFNTAGAGGLSGVYYKPLMPTAFSLIYTFFGANAAIFHLFQLVVHIANSALVFLILKTFFSKNLSFFLSLLFLVHPINTEAVVYISDYQDVLFFFFGALALLFAIKRNAPGRVSGLLLLSLLSKETGVVFVVSVLFYIALFKKKYLQRYLFASAIVVGVYLFLRLGVAQVPFASQELSPITRISLGQRLATLPKIFLFYLKTFLFPKDLAIAQHWTVKNLTFFDFYLPLAITLMFLLAMVFVLVFLLQKGRKEQTKAFIFFVGIFIAGLGIHMQIFPLDMTVADRWFYAPFLGVLGLIGILVSKVLPKQVPIKFLPVFAAIALILLSARSFVRTFDWRNGLTLFGNDIQISKDAFDLENNLGVELFRVGRYEEAKVHFENSVKLAPYWWTNWNNLGAIKEREGRFEQAEEFYTNAIDNGGYYLAYENLASLYLFKKKDYARAKEFCEDSLRLLPYNAKLWFVLALAEYQLGNKEKALQAAETAYRLNPNQETFYVLSRLQQNQKLELNF